MTDLSSYEKNDPDFLKDLMESKQSVERVALWLQLGGIEVEIAETKFRPNIELMSDYSDSGDLFLIARNEVGEITSRRPAEVKRRDVEFTCEKDYPYETVIVDVKHHWDRMSPKPVVYYILNKSMTSLCLIDTQKTAQSWMHHGKWDAKKSRDRSFLVCPKVLCYFITLATRFKRTQHKLRHFGALMYHQQSGK